MDHNTAAFCEELAKQCRGVKSLLEEHLADYDEMLPHVFLADVARFILAGTDERQCLIGFLEQGMQKQSEEVKNLIAVSFVEFFENERDFERALNGLAADALRTAWIRRGGPA